jgi:hypothetical protein
MSNGTGAEGMSDDPIQDLTKAGEALGGLIKAAGDNPDTREAGRQLGAAALIVSKTIKNALLPLAAVNFAVDKARDYFERVFPSEMEKKAAAIPPEAVIAPKPSIAGPALQGLAFSHEEPDLKEMYLSLLGKAMDGRVSGNVHPAFVEIIKQLRSDEAGILKRLSDPGATMLPLVRIIFHPANSGGGQFTVRNYVLPLFTADRSPVIVPMLSAMIDNWIRLGLYRADFSRRISGGSGKPADPYAWVDDWPEYMELKKALSPENLSLHRGILERTDFGLQFSAAVGLFSSGLEVTPASTPAPPPSSS